MQYGDVGYRRRYGNRFNYYARAGYEGLGDLTRAPAAIAAPTGYGQAIAVASRAPASGYGAIFGKK